MRNSTRKIMKTPIFFLNFLFFEILWLAASLDSLPNQNNIENENLEWVKIFINELQIFISDPGEVRIYMETCEVSTLMWWYYQREILFDIDLSGMFRFCIVQKSEILTGRHFVIKWLCKLCFYYYVLRPK